jgi:hypothetical protein
VPQNGDQFDPPNGGQIVPVNGGQSVPLSWDESFPQLTPQEQDQLLSQFGIQPALQSAPPAPAPGNEVPNNLIDPLLLNENSIDASGVSNFNIDEMFAEDSVNMAAENAAAAMDAQLRSQALAQLPATLPGSLWNGNMGLGNGQAGAHMNFVPHNGSTSVGGWQPGAQMNFAAQHGSTSVGGGQAEAPIILSRDDLDDLRRVMASGNRGGSIGAGGNRQSRVGTPRLADAFFDGQIVYSVYHVPID